MYYFVGTILTVRHLYYCPFSGADIVSYMREFGVRVLSVISLAAIANGKRPVPSHFLRKRLKQLSPQLIRRSLPLSLQCIFGTKHTIGSGNTITKSASGH